MSIDLHYNPTGGNFSNKLPMKSVDKLAYLNSIEDLYRYNGKHSIGAYYPVRTLPSIDIDKDAEWPVVMPAGCIVSIIPIKDIRSYTVDEPSAGISAGGMQAVAIGVDGTVLEKNIDYMYPKDVAGLIVPGNGGVNVDDDYTDPCGANGIINLSGEVVSSTSDAYTRVANRPIGIVNHKIFADMRFRFLNYDARQSSNSNTIALGGVLTIPYIGIYGGSAGDRATVLEATRNAVNAVHQYVWFNENTEADILNNLRVGEFLQSDSYGRFTTWDGSTEEQRFAKVIETRNRLPWNLDEIIDSFPGSGMKGMDTGGLKARIYNFIKSIVSTSEVKGGAYVASKDNIKKVLWEALDTDTGDVTIQIGQVDVAFGIMK